jgi:phosphate transport system substrate-binding protein
MQFLKMNEHAVSPIVATLVLIVVAVVGAVAVGTIMGTFSSDVAQQNNAGDVAGASATEIIVAGSTTVQPVSELLAKAYMDQKPGMKITVQAGGSGAGLTGANMGIVDIGASSENFDAVKYPELNCHEIGGSAVVAIIKKQIGEVNTTKAILEQFYVDGSGLIINGTIFNTAVHRAEDSGTEHSFAKWLGGSSGWIDAQTGGHLKTATGNQGVVDEVAKTPGAVGFCDYGIATSAANKDKVTIIGFTDGFTSDEITKDAIKAELKSKDGSNYYEQLARPLNYVTKGSESSVVKDFINFAKSPAAKTYFEQAGYFSIYDYM